MPKLQLRALKPPTLPNGEAYAKAMEKAVYKAAGLALRDLEATVRTWTKKPTFDVTITKDDGNYSVSAGTDNEIYGYVDKGTKRHAIKPKRGKYLRFSSGHKAKTRVGIIGSIEGGAFGGDVFSRGVMHPGFPGRKFTQKIAQRRQVTTAQEIDHQVALVARNKPA